MSRFHNILRLATLALICACTAPATRLSAAEVQLDPDIRRIIGYKALDDRQDLCAVQDRVRDAWGKPADLRHLQQQFVALLGLPTASADAKEFACGQLALIGDEQSVHALAGLLPDPRLSVMARFALERIPDSAPDKALRQALGRLGGLEKVGVINSIGERRDAGADKLLAKTLSDPDPMVTDAAAAALAKVGGPVALKALSQARTKSEPARRPMLTDACLLLARHLVAEGKADQAYALYQEIYQDATEPQGKRLAALTGLIAARPSACASLVLPILRGQDAALKVFALRFVREVNDAASAQAFAAELSNLPADEQVLLLSAMAAQKHPFARGVSRTAVLAAANAANDNVRLAALKALRQLGNSSDVPFLLAAATGDERRHQVVARETLDHIPGKDVDAALMAGLNGADASTRAELVRALAARDVSAASAEILRLSTQDTDSNVRVQALKALAVLAQQKDLPKVIEILKLAKTEDERHEAEMTTIAVCEKVGNESGRNQPILAALASETSASARASLLRVLGGVGGDAALPPIESALEDSDPTIHDTAIRVLADWADPKPIDVLLKLAQSATEPAQQVLCLRGYIRMVGLLKDSPAEKRLEMYNAAIKLARRADEKRLVLAGLAQLEEPKVLNAIDPYLEDPELQPDAASATLKVAFATRHKSKPDSLAAIEKVLKLVTNETLRAEALKAKENINLP